MNPVFFTYAGPPVIGAFIGYLTNKVAIRMLFRPLKPWHVFGLRVPMTPGVIPSKRHELAENIGIMVGEHLLTARDIGTALSMEPFQEHLHGLVGSRVNDVLESDLGTILTLVPERFRSYAKVGLRTLKYQMKDGIRTYLGSESFSSVFTTAVSEQLDHYSRRELNSLVSEGKREQLYGFMDDLLARLLNNTRTEKILSRYLVQRLQESARKGKTIQDLLPEPFIKLILDALKEQAPALLERLAGIIAEPMNREKIIQAVIGGIDHFLSSLGPMAAMAKGFINMESLDGVIRDYLVDHEEELKEWLQSDEVKEELVLVLQQQAQKMLQTPIAEILERVSNGRLEQVCESLAVQLLGAVRNPGTLEILSFLLRESFEEILDRGRKPTGEVVAQLFPGNHGDQIGEFFISELLTVLRSNGSKRLIGRMIDRMLDTLAKRPVGVLARLMPSGVRNGITDYIVLSANRMLLHEVPGLVKSLNISQLVADKVDSLDLLKLEDLLLSIMEEQFKYINLFGALLGFLIGLINLVILQVYYP